MQKIRQPDSFAGAVTLIAVTIGFDEAAKAIGKSEALVRKFTDPDCDSLPSVEQALAMDAAYVAFTGQPGPLCLVYGDKLKELVGQLQHAAKPPKERLIDIHGEVGGIHAAVADALSDGKVTNTERARIVKEAKEAIAAINALIRDVTKG